MKPVLEEKVRELELDNVHILPYQCKGNTAQSPLGGFVRNLLADFPSYCTEIP